MPVHGRGAAMISTQQINFKSMSDVQWHCQQTDSVANSIPVIIMSRHVPSTQRLNVPQHRNIHEKFVAVLYYVH
jgi:hypothetical protein